MSLIPLDSRNFLPGVFCSVRQFITQFILIHIEYEYLLMIVYCTVYVHCTMYINIPHHGCCVHYINLYDEFKWWNETCSFLLLFSFILLLLSLPANHHLLNECQPKYSVISFEDVALDYITNKTSFVEPPANVSHSSNMNYTRNYLDSCVHSDIIIVSVCVKFPMHGLNFMAEWAWAW